MRRLRRGLGIAAAASLVIVLLWSAGLAYFLIVGQRPGPRKMPPSDAIVVLTGGSGRVESGFALLRAGKGKTLFISGVNPRVDLAELMRVSGTEPASIACCVVLGHHADNTFENAGETARWMRRERYRSLRLVTAWYHMPRSLLDFRRAMPDIEIIPHPVFPADVPVDRWWAARGTFFLIMREYAKYLAALAGSLVPSGEPAAPPGQNRHLTASGR